MHRVKTDFHALFIGLLLVSALTYFAAGYEILPSPKVRTLDAAVLWCLSSGIIHLAVFIPGHLLFRRLRVDGRWPYAGLGALGCSVALLSHAALPRLLESGLTIAFLLFTAVAGAIFGFLYHWRAGYDAAGDDPAVLARMIVDNSVQPGAPGTFGRRQASISPDRALIDTSEEEYFEGPVQVRTSVPVAFIAALVSTSAFGVCKYVFGLGVRAQDLVTSGPEMAEKLSHLAGFEGGMLLGTIVLGTLPVAVIILAAHTALRAMDRQSYAAYAVAGLVTPVVLGLLAFVVFVFLGLLLAIPSAIAMMVYRNMAGLEPKPVREDILVNDPRNLVGADHARRRYGRVIKAG